MDIKNNLSLITRQGPNIVLYTRKLFKIVWDNLSQPFFALLEGDTYIKYQKHGDKEILLFYRKIEMAFFGLNSQQSYITTHQKQI